jgi:periplasmic copper chaperone A
VSVTTHRLVAAIGAAIALALATACGGVADAGSDGGDGGDGADDLDVTDVWAAQADDVAAVYLTIDNRGDADRLVAISTDAASDVSLMGSGGADASAHTSGHAPVDLPVPPGATSFEPGGRHVMLDGLVPPLRPGDRVPLTLRFERAGARTVDVQVVDWDEVSERLP